MAPGALLIAHPGAARIFPVTRLVSPPSGSIALRTGSAAGGVGWAGFPLTGSAPREAAARPPPTARAGANLNVLRTGHAARWRAP